MKAGKWVALALWAGAAAAWAGGDGTEPAPPGAQASPAESKPRGSAAPRAAARPNAYAPDAALTATRSTAPQREERSFIRQAATIARFETQASELALTRGQSPRVREFAQKLKVQQTNASAELLRLLHARGMAMPMLENSQRKTLTRLGRLSGTRFDREYLEAVALRQQREKVLAYQRATAVVADPAIKAWVERQLPLARDQVAAAERLGGPATGARAPGRSVAPTSLAR